MEPLKNIFDAQINNKYLNKNDEPLILIYLCYTIHLLNNKFTFENEKKRDLVLGSLDSFGESAFRKNGKREGTAIV